MGISVSQFSRSDRMNDRNWPVHVGIFLDETVHYSLIWVLPAFLISVLISRFKLACNDTRFQDYHNILIAYESIASSTSNFSLYYFFCIQSYTIFNTFAYITTLSEEQWTLREVIFYGGSFVHIFSLLFNLQILTSSMDEAFQDLQHVKRSILEKLRPISLDEAQRLELSYFKDRIDMIRPMSASGYFDIDKTTLTSMLSVR